MVELLNSNLFTVEFHCHTIYSHDSLTTPEQLVAACQRKGITRVIITDHNTIRGAQLAQEIDPERVIVGEEVMTQDGELLAAFVKERVPPWLPAKEAIGALRQQGAFISVSHPFDVTRGGHWKIEALERILPEIDAIEIFNARCVSPSFNTKAAHYAIQHQLPGTAGSDAHTTFELGRGMLRLPGFHDAVTLKAALVESQLQTMLSSPLVHVTSRYAKIYKKLFRRMGRQFPTDE